MNQRLIWGTLGGLLLLVIIWAGGLWYTLAIGLLATLGILEYAELIKKQQIRSQTQVMLFISLLTLALIYVISSHTGLNSFESLRISERSISLILILAFVLIFIAEMAKGKSEQGYLNASANLFGTVYIGFMFAYILLLRFIPESNGFYIWYSILVTWSNDSMAYFIGINFGKHKLCPQISPKKSIEGSIGGLIGGIFTSLIMGFLYHKNLWVMSLLGIITVVAGQFGDLIESIIKRNAGVKDSGSFLPGHGGVLDRFDSLLIAAPVVYYMATYVIPYL